MRKNIFIVLAFLAAGMMFSFIGWSFSLHGTIGMVRVNGSIKLLFIALALAAALLLGLALIREWLKRTNRRTVVLSISVIIFIVLDFVVPAGGFVYASGFPGSHITGTQPELLLGYGMGSQGIPNVMVVAYSNTSDKESLTWGTSTTQHEITEAGSGLQHLFLLKDLSPDTEYQYRMGNGQTYSFKTPSLSSTDLHIAIGSDTHFGAGDNRSDLTIKMLAQIASPQNNFDYFFSLGDLVEYGFSDSMWKEALDAFSRTSSSIPTGLIIGNHETIFTGLSRYEKYCRPGITDFTDGNNLRYRLDIGRVHILVMDLEWSAESYPEQQTKWLEQQLASIPAGDWKIVMNHSFYYASGYEQDGWKWYDNPETIKLYTPLFEKYGVNLVFSGHDHDLELLQHSGVTYVIDGGFGGLPDPPRTYVSPASIWYASGEYGYVDLTINNDNADIIFRDPDNNILKEIQIPQNYYSSFSPKTRP